MAHRPIQNVNASGGLIFYGAGTFATVVDESLSTLLFRHTGTGVDQLAQFRRGFRLPQHFEAWDSIVGFVRRNGATDSLTATLSKAGAADSTINALDIRPASDVTWVPLVLTPGSSYSPGNFCALEIASMVDSGEIHEIRNFMYLMRTRGGRRVIGQRLQFNGGSTTGSGTFSQVYDVAGRFVYRQHQGSGAGQVGKIYFPQRIFKNWVGWHDYRIDTFRTASTTSLTAALLVNGVVDPNVNEVNVYPSAADAYQTKTLTPSAVAPDDLTMLRLTSTVNSGGIIRIRDSEVEYRA